MKQSQISSAKIRLATLLLCAAAMPTLFSLNAAASPADENWPQWRGPTATGASPDAHPPTTWSETSNVKWKVKIPGNGSATPIIWEDMVFVQTAIPTGKKTEAQANANPPPDRTIPPGPRDQGGLGGPGPGGGRPGPGGRGGPRPGGGMGGEKPTEAYQFVLMCLDRQTGKTLWQKTAREEVPHEGVKPGDGSFASASPLTDGTCVYAFFGSHGLYCYDLKGNLKWQKDLGKMRIKMAFGEGSSPVLYKDTVVVTWDNEGGSFIVAFDKTTGNELWREKREEGTSWATPIVVEHGGQAEVITDATAKIRSYNLADGHLIWECTGLTANVIPSPVADSDTVYSMSGFRGHNCMAIKLGHTGDIAGTDAIAWSYGKGTPYVPSPLLYGGKLYFFADNNGVLTCIDAKTGKGLIDAERLDDLKMVYASPVGADGRVYLVARGGTTVVIKASDKLEILATNKLDDGFDASPALAGKQLFLRGRENLYCIEQK